MYAYFRGKPVKTLALSEDGPYEIWFEAGSVGYKILVSAATAMGLNPQQEAILYVSQSAAMYGGETTLYGFLSPEDRALFELLREIPGAGAKKALDYLEKIQEKSRVSFLQALVRGDAKVLAGVFGFTSKTVTKMIANLKDKAEALMQQYLAARFDHSGEAAIADEAAQEGFSWLNATLWGQARDALVALGFDMKESESALSAVLKQQSQEGERRETSLESLIRLALKELSQGKV